VKLGARPLLGGALLVLAGCTIPVPPGTRVEIVYPPSHCVVEPRTTLLINTVAWGPGFRAQGWQREDWLIPALGAGTIVEVDGQPVARSLRARLHRVPLELVEGRHLIRARSWFGSDAIELQVAPAPEITFQPATSRDLNQSKEVPAAVQKALEEYRARTREPIHDQHILATEAGTLVLLHQGETIRAWVFALGEQRVELGNDHGAALEFPNPMGRSSSGFQGVGAAACAAQFIVAHFEPGTYRLVVDRLQPGSAPARETVDLKSLCYKSELGPLPAAADLNYAPWTARCFGSMVSLSTLAPRGNRQIFLYQESRAQWRLIAAEGELVCLGENRWARFDKCTIRWLDHADPPVAVPLPFRAATWSSANPLRRDFPACSLGGTNPVLVRIDDGGPEGSVSYVVRLGPLH